MRTQDRIDRIDDDIKDLTAEYAEKSQHLADYIDDEEAELNDMQSFIGQLHKEREKLYDQLYKEEQDKGKEV